MNTSATRTIAPLAVMCFICLFFVFRTEGFDNIRAVQFLLIFVAGALVGLIIGIIRATRLVRQAQ